MALNVLVADDHEVVWHGLRSLFKDSPISICGEAKTPEETVKLARKLKPDVVLLDVRLGPKDGIDAIRKIRVASPETRVVVLSAFDNPTYIARAVAAGAHDYILKTAGREDLIAAIRGAEAGSAPTRSGQLRKMAGAMASREQPADTNLPLTPREIQTLRLVAMGLSNKEIADSLEISVETVKEHVQNMLRKLSVSDRTQAAVWAIRHGVA
jgi:DNA-binding NarL/FixJ family response regulator